MLVAPDTLENRNHANNVDDNGAEDNNGYQQQPFPTGSRWKNPFQVAITQDADAFVVSGTGNGSKGSVLDLQRISD